MKLLLLFEEEEREVVNLRESERALFGEGKRKKLEVRRGKRRTRRRRGRWMSDGGCILLGRSMAAARLAVDWVVVVLLYQM